jgi:CubicO group peptidase (beta-lactamase class C family)
MLKKYHILMIGCMLGLAFCMPHVRALLLIEKDKLTVHIIDDTSAERECMVTKKLECDTQITTASGCTFTAEKGWYVTQYDTIIVLQEPDQELSLTLLENTEQDALAAVNAAWKRVQQDFAREIQHTMSLVPQDGWDEIIQYVYATTAQENRFVFATARRAGKVWYIELTDGTKAAFERRMAGVLLVNTSFKVPGTQEESFAFKKAHTLDAARLKEFMTFVEDAREQCDVPGVAIGIVQNGKIIWEQGLGLRTLGAQEKVTPQTLFMIGSTTKSLTTFMMARLVDEGKFAWDTPVTEVMPDFALGDKATTQRMLMKYTVSASTGMPRQDLEAMFNYDQATVKYRMDEMRSMKPTTGFGETFQYSNAMVAAGGYIAAHAADPTSELGKAYDMVMQSRVFDAIGMPSTTFDFAQVEKVDHAAPHGLDLHGKLIPLHACQEEWVTSIRPAGGAWSNVHDMAQYIITELNKGITAEGKRIISETNLLKRREPQIKIADKMSYGLALMMENSHGVLSVGHDGMTLGFSSLMFFLPEHNVGLVMLTNARGAMVFTHAIKRKFMELLFDGKLQASEMVKIGIEQQKQMFKKNLEDITFNPDSTWLKQFVGTYVHPTLGQIAIREVEGGAQVDARVWTSSIGQKKEKDGSCALILTDVPVAGLEFLPQRQDDTMQLKLEIGQHIYVFVRT